MKKAIIKWRERGGWMEKNRKQKRSKVWTTNKEGKVQSAVERKKE